jgi:Big-like domain-containing protein/FG-GAP repeat protein
MDARPESSFSSRRPAALLGCLTLIATACLIGLTPRPAEAHATFAILTGAGPRGGPHVRSFTRALGATTPAYYAYNTEFRGGIFVASGDVTGDGHADSITGAGAGGGPDVRVVDGITGQLVRRFYAYNPEFRGGVSVAAGDLNGDRRADIITGAGPGGGPHVKVFDGATGEVLGSFYAYEKDFRGGVFVAAGDVNADFFTDVITGGGPGPTKSVKVFNPQTGKVLRSITAYPSFRGGVTVASGDVNADGYDDVITGAGPGGGPHVKAFDGNTGAQIRSFYAYNVEFRGGVFVAAGDVSIDSNDDIITGAGAGGGPHVKVFDGNTGATIRSFFAYNPEFRGGVRVAGNLGTEIPTIQVTGGPPDQGTTTDTTPTYSGTAADTDGIVVQIQVFVDSGDFASAGVVCTGCGTASATWEWTPTTALGPGEHTIVFSVKDNSGTLGVDARTVTVI